MKSVEKVTSGASLGSKRSIQNSLKSFKACFLRHQKVSSYTLFAFLPHAEHSKIPHQDVERASKIVDGYNEHAKKGIGAFTLDGKMIDMPVVKWAQRLIQQNQRVLGDELFSASSALPVMLLLVPDDAISSSLRNPNDDKKHQLQADDIAGGALLAKVKIFFDHLAETYEALLPGTILAFADLNPDIVVCDGISAFCIQAARMQKAKLVIVWPAATSGIPESPGALHPSSVIPSVGMDGKLDGSLQSRVKQLLVSTFLAGVVRYANNAAFAINERLGVETLLRPKSFLLDELVISWTAYGIDYPQMQPPLLKLVGPLIREPLPPLPSEYIDFMGTTSEIILVSFGSVVTFTEPNFRHLHTLLQNATASHPNLKVIWSVSNKQSKLLPPSLDPFHRPIKTDPPSTMTLSTDTKFLYTRWAPQRELLSHPSTILLIGHSGGNGIHEPFTTPNPFSASPPPVTPTKTANG
ncbi:UDP glycosyltransferase 8 [Rhizophlyctis rosea]|uniref:UDP glycosyltransferase 8 n=1 Tax=Rhizophlyctis rosea TaxID=64517 RepID=A0AAD5SF49_9FUNG|nr:UDP glycosyltransferase 8 [Rhizophlyctis rosea]